MVFVDRLTATLIHLRHDLPHAVLGLLFGVDRSTITRAVGQIRTLLAERGCAVPNRAGATVAAACPTPGRWPPLRPPMGALHPRRPTTPRPRPTPHRGTHPRRLFPPPSQKRRTPARRCPPSGLQWPRQPRLTTRARPSPAPRYRPLRPGRPSLLRGWPRQPQHGSVSPRQRRSTRSAAPPGSHRAS
nr:transposase family protein [Nocardiopsis sinuspersici]